jgi:hypothetical protein
MWIAFWIAFAIIVAAYASNKGRSGVGFFFLSLVLSPLVGFLIAAVCQRNPEVIAERKGMKKCPDCAELVQGEARVCRFCGHKFSGAQPELTINSSPTSPERKATTTDRKADASPENTVQVSQPNSVAVGVKLFLIGIFLLTGIFLAVSGYRSSKHSGTTTVARGHKFTAVAPNLRCTAEDPEAEAVAAAPLKADENHGIYERVSLKRKVANSRPNSSMFVFAYVEANSGSNSEKTVVVRLVGDHCDISDISAGDLTAAKLQRDALADAHSGRKQGVNNPANISKQPRCSVTDPAAEDAAWEHIRQGQRVGIVVNPHLKAKYNEPPNGSAFDFASMIEPAHIAYTGVVHIRLVDNRCAIIGPETEEPASLAGH